MSQRKSDSFLQLWNKTGRERMTHFQMDLNAARLVLTLDSDLQFDDFGFGPRPTNDSVARKPKSLVFFLSNDIPVPQLREGRGGADLPRSRGARSLFRKYSSSWPRLRNSRAALRARRVGNHGARREQSRNVVFIQISSRNNLFRRSCFRRRPAFELEVAVVVSGRPRRSLSPDSEQSPG